MEFSAHLNLFGGNRCRNSQKMANHDISEFYVLVKHSMTMLCCGFTRKYKILRHASRDGEVLTQTAEI